jgi:hypothetical protein
VSKTSRPPEPYGSAGGTQTLGNREVVAIVVACGDPQEMLLSFSGYRALSPDRLCATQRKISNRSRLRLGATELRHCGGQLCIERDLNSWTG